MTGRAIRAAARIAFIACGLISLFTCVPYVMMRGAELPVQSEWILFTAALTLIALPSVALGILPRAWIAKSCGKNRDDDRLFVTPLRWLGCFAAISYLVAIGVYFAPNQLSLNPQLMFSLCPMYFIKMTFDPSLVAILFLLAPLNAGAYGAMGATLGFGWIVFGKRRDFH